MIQPWFFRWYTAAVILSSYIMVLWWFPTFNDSSHTGAIGILTWLEVRGQLLEARMTASRCSRQCLVVQPCCQMMVYPCRQYQSTKGQRLLNNIHWTWPIFRSFTYVCPLSMAMLHHVSLLRATAMFDYQRVRKNLNNHGSRLTELRSLSNGTLAHFFNSW